MLKRCRRLKQDSSRRNTHKKYKALDNTDATQKKKKKNIQEHEKKEKEEQIRQHQVFKKKRIITYANHSLFHFTTNLRQYYEMKQE